jgi:Universal stress protein family.
MFCSKTVCETVCTNIYGRTYERGVSFDTFDNFDATDFSLTLNYKHKGYQSTRRSRTFLCGTDQNDYSEFALEWLIDELVDDGDEIVCLRAVEKDSRIASDVGIEERKYREEAEKLFEQVIQKNSQDEKAISLVLELAVGKVESIIQRMVTFPRTPSLPTTNLISPRFAYTSLQCL